MTTHTYNPTSIRATYTLPDGTEHEFRNLEMIEPIEFKTIPPVPQEYTITIEGTFTTTGPPLLVGGKEWMERLWGHRGRRVVGRKIRQARRRMLRIMASCL